MPTRPSNPHTSFYFYIVHEGSLYNISGCKKIPQSLRYRTEKKPIKITASSALKRPSENSIFSLMAHVIQQFNMCSSFNKPTFRQWAPLEIADGIGT